MDATTTGERVRMLRKLRGLTQQDLARLSRLSLRTIKAVEADEGNHRNETLHAVARALQAHTSDFTTRGQREHQPVPGEPWEDVRDVLYQRVPSEEPREPATPKWVLAGLADLKPDWEANRYSQVRLMLPGVIRDAMSLDDEEDCRAARSQVLSATASLLTMTRQFDDAWTAAQLALDAAPDLMDSLAAVSQMTWGLLRQGRTREAGALAIGWADRAEPRFSRATTGELAGYGKLMLYVANAMTTDNQPGEAQDALSLARAAAVLIGRDVPYHPSTVGRFGPATVMTITAETAALTWQPDKVLAIADRVRASLAGIDPSRRLRHMLDVASAHEMRRQYGDVVAIMQEIQQDAPEWLGYQQYARDILERVISRRRGPLTEELRDLAAAVQLPA
jgi:transcriptional regulator with XRE-family HTH domain